MINFIRLHKNFFVEITLLAAAALSITVCGINIYYIIFSLVIHELGHIVVALLSGAKAENFTIHGFGVEITFPGKTLIPSTMLLISSGGPIISLVTGIISYYFNLKLLSLSNFTIAFINMLPVYPLDGGYVFSSLLSSFIARKKIHQIMKTLGKIFGTVISICGLFILFISNFNISLIYIGLFIFFSSDRLQNPVIEVTSAQHKAIEKCSVFIIDESTSILDAAGSLPINSIGVIKNKDGELISMVTPLYLYKQCINNTHNIKKPLS